MTFPKVTQRVTAELRAFRTHQCQCQEHHPAWDQELAKQALGAHLLVESICAAATESNSKALQSTSLLRAKIDGVAGLSMVQKGDVKQAGM